MGQVGQFPGLDVHRRMIKSPVNPLDKSTVISIYPVEVDEVKPTIFPGRFIIPAGSYEKPSILTIGPSSWWREIDEEQPMLEIPVSSIQIADSIVKDYCNGILGCDMASAMPGLFYIPGEQTLESIRKSYLNTLNEALTRQRKWYTTLVRMADVLWARSSGNPAVVSDDMRLAARELGQHGTKDWMKDSQMAEMVRCKACGSLRNPAYPICSTCKAIDDPTKAKELGLVFAQ